LIEEFALEVNVKEYTSKLNKNNLLGKLAFPNLKRGKGWGSGDGQRRNH